MRLITDIDRNGWADFVLNHPEGNIFQTPEMFDVLKMSKNNYPISMAVVNIHNEILGILVAVIQIEYPGILGKFSRRAIIRGGPLILDDNPAVLNFLLKEYNKIIQKEAIYTQVRNLWEHGHGFRCCFEFNGFQYEEHLDILLYIDRPENALWKNLHAKKRNKIRRARQEGTTFAELTSEETVNEAYNILAEVYGRVKLPFGDRSLFEATFAELYPKGMIHFFGAFYKDKLIGVLAALCYKDRIYDWYAGSYLAYHNKFPNDLLPWEIFLWGREKGYKIFDFGGAGKPGISYGVREHKKKFGGEMVCFGRYEKIHNPLLMKMGKLGFKLRQFFT